MIDPDKGNNWLNVADTDWDTLLPLADKQVKRGKSEAALFKFFSLGVATNRDEWVIDRDKKSVGARAKYFIDKYNGEVERWQKEP